MEPFERDLDSFLDDVVSLCKKHEIRIGDLNSLAKQANSIRGSFAFAKKLVVEISSEGTATLAKLRSVEAALKEEQESHEADTRALKETIEKQKEENARWVKQDEEKEMKCKNLEESIVHLKEELKNAGESESMIKEELQKAYLTCTSYEEQILLSFLEARPSYLQAFFDEIDAAYGSFERYVAQGLRLTPTQCDCLRMLVGEPR